MVQCRNKGGMEIWEVGAKGVVEGAGSSIVPAFRPGDSYSKND